MLRTWTEGARAARHCAVGRLRTQIFRVHGVGWGGGVVVAGNTNSRVRNAGASVTVSVHGSDDRTQAVFLRAVAGVRRQHLTSNFRGRAFL